MGNSFFAMGKFFSQSFVLPILNQNSDLKNLMIEMIERPISPQRISSARKVILLIFFLLFIIAPGLRKMIKTHTKSLLAEIIEIEIEKIT